MIWRRLIGAIFMIIGAAMAVAMTTLAVILLFNFLEWQNTVTALRSMAMVIIPAIVARVIVLVIGRWAYGDFKESAPMTNASSVAVKAAGILIAAGLGAMLLFLLFAGIGPDDMTTAVALAVGAIVGGLLVFLGARIKPINRRSYLD